MLLDGSEPIAASRASTYLERTAPLYAQRLSDAPVASGLTISTTVEPRSRVWFNEEMREETFRLPGSMATSVAMLAAFFLSLLERILSGQILPVENMPRAAQLAAQLAPLTHFTAIVRKVMFKGSDVTDLGPELLALTLLGLGLYGVAARRLQKTLE